MKFPHNISRLEAFSDAVFAFAATLMVVSLGTGDSFTELKNNLFGFISFGVSFFVLVGLWMLHYNYFRRNKYVDNWIITLNAILLFVILYFVFPLKSLTASWLRQQGMTRDELASLFVLYSLGFFMIFLCIALMYYRAYKKSPERDNTKVLWFYSRHFTIFVVVSAISIIIAISKIGIQFGLPGFVYMLLGPMCYWHSLIFQKKHGSI